MRKRFDSFQAWSRPPRQEAHSLHRQFGHHDRRLISAIFIFYRTQDHSRRHLGDARGNVIATLPSYHLNRLWAWGKRGPSAFRKEIVRTGHWPSPASLQPDRCLRRATSFVRTSGATWLIRRWSLSQSGVPSRSSGLEVGRVQQDLPLRQTQGDRRELVPRSFPPFPMRRSTRSERLTRRHRRVAVRAHPLTSERRN